MNPLPMVFCAAAICSAIQGGMAGLLTWWWLGAAFVVTIYHNLQWAKVFKAAATVIAAWSARREP